MASLNYKLAALEKACLSTGIVVQHNYSMMYLTMQRADTGFKLDISYQFIDHFTGKWTFFIDLFMEKENSYLKSIQGKSQAAAKFLEKMKQNVVADPNVPMNKAYVISTHNPETGKELIDTKALWLAADFLAADFSDIEKPPTLTGILQNEMYFVKKYTTEQQMNAATKLIEDIYAIKNKEAKKVASQPSNVNYANKLSSIVPSMHSETECPGDILCDCNDTDCLYKNGKCDRKDSVWGMIQHLNDSHKWSREKIADWIDDLQDNHGYNFTIESPNMDRS